VLYNLNKTKHSHRTMGPAIVSKPDPSHPLRRRENYIELPKSIYIYIFYFLDILFLY
jgi:hypothetical protein